MPLPFRQQPNIFSKNPKGITLKDAISIYKWLLDDGKIAPNGAAYNRMKQLQQLYNSGLREFPKKKTS